MYCNTTNAIKNDFKAQKNINALHDSALAGDSTSMIKLAIHYLYDLIHEDSIDDSKGTNNFVQAIYWLEKASGQEPALAYYWLGEAMSFDVHSSSSGCYRSVDIKNLLLYDDGVKNIYNNVAKNSIVKRYLDNECDVYMNYMSYFEKAAQLGNCSAMYRMGEDRLNKWIANKTTPDMTPHPADLEAAKKWLTRAALGGETEAVELLFDVIEDNV